MVTSREDSKGFHMESAVRVVGRTAVVGHTAVGVQVVHIAAIALGVGRRTETVVAREGKDMAGQEMRCTSAMMQENLKNISGLARFSWMRYPTWACLGRG